MESKPNSHDIEPVAQDCEDNGTDIEDQSPNEGLQYYKIAIRILFNAALKDKWRVAEPILTKEPRFVSLLKSDNNESLLHVAAQARSIEFVRKLMNIMEVGELELKDIHGNTAFFRAVASGFIEIAKTIRERNNNLPNIPGVHDDVGEVYPITMAAMFGYKDMVSYLFKVTTLDMLHQQERLLLLQYTIQNEMYQVALNIFNKDRKLLATKILQENDNVLYILSQKSLAISNQGGKFMTWVLPERCILKKQAGLILLEELWAECETNAEDKLLEIVRRKTLLHLAAKAGNVEFLAVAIHNHPNLIWEFHRRWTIFHFAVFYRQEKVFSLIHQIEGMKSLLLQRYDINGNNILHLAGILEDQSNLYNKEKIIPPSFLRVSGAALQMQREILWFKEVEKLLPPAHHKIKNKAGKTPKELFTEEHKLLLKEGERWMKDTANSCMIVATLIATMVFAAGFTVPGGNNDDNGIPILLNSNGFRVFVISDAVALFSSIISIIMFLSILTSRYAEDDFLVSLPSKLLFGLTALFVSIVSMLLAFTATFFLVYSNQPNWEPKLIAACAGIPVALFGCLQYKLWFDVAKSTYWSKFLFRPVKHKFY